MLSYVVQYYQFKYFPNFVYDLTINILSEITSSEHNPDLAEKLKGVFVTASGTSFYKQCVPDDTLSLVCSSTTLHYTSTWLVSAYMYWSNLSSKRYMSANWEWSMSVPVLVTESGDTVNTVTVGIDL